MTRSWKEAASIIIAGRSNIFKNNRELGEKDKNHQASVSDFKILALKRGKTSNFFPGGYVFPGGTVEGADSSEEWLKLYIKFGFQHKNFEHLVSLTPKTSLFQDNTSMPKAITLRITAIRETFEESGILLCKSRKYSTSQPSSWASFLTGYQVNAWQKEIQNDPNNFIKLCNDFQCVPDVWSLHLWSNWLTPVNNPIRFDTAFFLATLDQLPPSKLDKKEMDDIKWSTPKELLQGNKQDIWLPPPQYYEISRIDNFSELQQLHDFALKRTQQECERWMPFQNQADDGIITILPGDELYPENIKYEVKEKLTKVEGTMENLRKDISKLHRMELSGKNGIKICISNVEPKCGHLLPSNCT